MAQKKPPFTSKAVEPAPVNPVCGHCHHWRQKAESLPGKGECSAHPPELTLSLTGGVVAIRPPVLATETCGEWQAKGV